MNTMAAQVTSMSATSGKNTTVARSASTEAATTASTDHSSNCFRQACIACRFTVITAAPSSPTHKAKPRPGGSMSHSSRSPATPSATPAASASLDNPLRGSSFTVPASHNVIFPPPSIRYEVLCISKYGCKIKGLASPSVPSNVLYRLDQGLHMSNVTIQRLAPCIRQPVIGARHAAIEALVAGDVAPILKLAGVGTQVAVGGTKQGLEFIEAERIVCRQGADHGQPGPLVDQAIEIVTDLLCRAACLRLYRAAFCSRFCPIRLSPHDASRYRCQRPCAAPRIRAPGSRCLWLAGAGSAHPAPGMTRPSPESPAPNERRRS